MPLRSVLNRLRLSNLFDDPDKLIIEITAYQNKGKDYIQFTYILHEAGGNRINGTVTLPRLYAAPIEDMLSRIDPTFNIELKGSCLINTKGKHNG